MRVSDSVGARAGDAGGAGRARREGCGGGFSGVRALWQRGPLPARHRGRQPSYFPSRPRPLAAKTQTPMCVVRARLRSGTPTHPHPHPLLQNLSMGQSPLPGGAGRAATSGATPCGWPSTRHTTPSEGDALQGAQRQLACPCLSPYMARGCPHSTWGPELPTARPRQAEHGAWLAPWQARSPLLTQATHCNGSCITKRAPNTAQAKGCGRKTWVEGTPQASSPTSATAEVCRSGSEGRRALAGQPETGKASASHCAFGSSALASSGLSVGGAESSACCLRPRDQGNLERTGLPSRGAVEAPPPKLLPLADTSRRLRQAP